MVRREDYGPLAGLPGREALASVPWHWLPCPTRVTEPLASAGWRGSAGGPSRRVQR